MAAAHAAGHRVDTVVPSLAAVNPVRVSSSAGEDGTYAIGDVIELNTTFNQAVEATAELRATGVDHKSRSVNLEGADGRSVAWEPNRIAARAGGVEVYRSEEIEFRAGDRIRWTRNDAGLGPVNSGTAEVAAVRDGRVTLRLEGGRMLDLSPGDPQLRHVDRAWASTVHAFQGRTVDTVIAAMEANHPHLTTQKSFYVEISRARDKAELVTDDKAELKEQLEAPAGKALGALPRALATAPGAVDVAVVAAPATDNLTVTGGAGEQAGGVLHRDR